MKIKIVDSICGSGKTSGIINKMLKKKSDWTVLDVEFWLRINNIKVNAYRIYTMIKEING